MLGPSGILHPMNSDGVCCLRCKDMALVGLPSPAEITFYECPACGRHYAQEPSGHLTFRWLHPISLVLYGFTSTPDGSTDGNPESVENYAVRTAKSLAIDQTTQQLNAFIHEIELELNEPTQPVKDIIGTKASEQECRAFLRLVTAAMTRETTMWRSVVRNLASAVHRLRSGASDSSA
jgi:hypothetical protein